MSGDSCISAKPALKVYAPEPWLVVLEGKIAALLEDAKSPALLASRIPWFKCILLKLLGIRVLKYRDGLAIWGFVGDSRTNDVIVIELSSEDWYRIYSRKLPRILALPLSEPLRVLLYAAIGVMGVFVNLASAVSAHSALVKAIGHLANPIASSVGFEVSTLFNFALHETVTFRNAGLSRIARKVLERCFRYHVASITSWLSQVTVATSLPALLKVPFWSAQLTGIIVGFIASFILGYLYTWSMHRL